MANKQRQYVVEHRERDQSNVTVSRFGTSGEAQEFVDTGRRIVRDRLNAEGRIVGEIVLREARWDYFVQYCKGGVSYAPSYD